MQNTNYNQIRAEQEVESAVVLEPVQCQFHVLSSSFSMQMTESTHKIPVSHLPLTAWNCVFQTTKTKKYISKHEVIQRHVVLSFIYNHNSVFVLNRSCIISHWIHLSCCWLRLLSDHKLLHVMCLWLKMFPLLPPNICGHVVDWGHTFASVWIPRLQECGRCTCNKYNSEGNTVKKSHFNVCCSCRWGFSWQHLQGESLSSR